MYVMLDFSSFSVSAKRACQVEHVGPCLQKRDSVSLAKDKGAPSATTLRHPGGKYGMLYVHTPAEKEGRDGPEEQAEEGKSTQGRKWALWEN